MSNYDRGRNMPDLLPMRDVPYIRHLPAREPVPDPEPRPPANHPSAAYTATCDSGFCDDVTVAVVRSIEGAWMSMCKEHTAAELAVL